MQKKEICVPKSETLKNFFLEVRDNRDFRRMGKWGNWRKWGNNNKVYRILGQGCYIFVA